MAGLARSWLRRTWSSTDLPGDSSSLSLAWTRALYTSCPMDTLALKKRPLTASVTRDASTS